MVRCRSVLFLAMLMTLAAVVSAQITFSRDWSGGKRAVPPLKDVGLDCTQFARLCRHFVHELKSNLAESSAPSNKQRSEDIAPLYDDEK